MDHVCLNLIPFSILLAFMSLRSLDFFFALTAKVSTRYLRLIKVRKIFTHLLREIKWNYYEKFIYFDDLTGNSFFLSF